MSRLIIATELIRSHPPDMGDVTKYTIENLRWRKAVRGWIPCEAVQGKFRCLHTLYPVYFWFSESWLRAHIYSILSSRKGLILRPFA